MYVADTKVPIIYMAYGLQSAVIFFIKYLIPKKIKILDGNFPDGFA